jgi:hypothetical protein
MEQHSFGCLESPFDERDFQLASYLQPVGLPTTLTYRNMMTPVRNQGGLGSCVGFASTAIDEHIHQASDLSEMWCYDQCKKLDKFPGEGTFPRAAMKVLQDGIPDEVYWPYVDRYPPGTEPIPGAAGDAAQYRIGTYAMTPNIEALKAGLFQHGPMLLAIQIFENYGQGPKPGVIPKGEGRVLGGHAVCLVGYDDLNQMWIFKNSWGTSWGDRGYGFIGYDAMPSLFWEAWTVVDESTVPKRWPDLPDMTSDDLLSQDRAWQEGIMKGYEDGTFRPYEPLTTHQVGTVAVRMGLLDKNPWNENSDYSLPTTRGFVHEKLPQLRFDEERFDEPITRFQTLLLIGRYKRGV